MAWKIDRDYLADGGIIESEVGTQSLGPELEGKTYRFRLLDDDNEVYYGGVVDKNAVDKEDSDEFQEFGIASGMPTLQTAINAEQDSIAGTCYELGIWGEGSGALWLEFHAKDAVELGLLSQEYLDKHEISDEDWVRPFC
jgi:hypothetical protein